jgi:hypothetical protein
MLIEAPLHTVEIGPEPLALGYQALKWRTIALIHQVDNNRAGRDEIVQRISILLFKFVPDAAIRC